MIYGRTPKCPKCGREPIGVTVTYGYKLFCSNCTKDKDEPMYCERGCKVEFAFPESGREQEQEEAKKVLDKGAVYEVESVVVGGFSSEIELKEFPGRKFNSVFFRRVQ